MTNQNRIAKFCLGAKEAEVAAVSLFDLDSKEGMLRYICLKALEERGKSGLDHGNKVVAFCSGRLSEVTARGSK